MNSRADCLPWLSPSAENAEIPAAAACPEAVADALLTAAAGRGDAESFRLLVEKYGAALRGFCLHVLGCPQEAQDAAQEAFVRVWCGLRDAEGSYEERGKFRAWLWRVALNLCRDRRRARAASIRRLEVWEALQRLEREAAECPAQAAERRADLRRLAQGLETLPEKLRLPLWLCGVENLSHAECAAVLEISPRAVEGRLRRARQKLLDWWNREI